VQVKLGFVNFWEEEVLNYFKEMWKYIKISASISSFREKTRAECNPDMKEECLAQRDVR